LLAHGRWFSPGTPASSTTNTGRHHIAEKLLKVALKPKILKNQYFAYCIVCPSHYGVEETQNGLKGMIPQRDSDSFVIRDSSR
jgi:hypothetical protein